MTSIDVAINYQKNNSKGKMSPEELLKFLSNFAKAKNISADWKQIIIQDPAYAIDREAGKSENTSEKGVKDEKTQGEPRVRKRSEIAKFI